MKGIATHTTHSRAVFSTNSDAFERATVKMAHLFSTGHLLETFLREDSHTQVSWRPGIPPLTHPSQRDRIMPHYRTALENWHRHIGKETVIHGGLSTEGAIKGKTAA